MKSLPFLSLVLGASLIVGCQGTFSEKPVAFNPALAATLPPPPAPASAADLEMPAAKQDLKLFADPLCSRLKSGTTAKQVAAMQTPFLKAIATAMLQGAYDQASRVRDYEAYPTVEATAKFMKTSGYSRFENPTGIYFAPGETAIIFVGDCQGQAPALIVSDFARGRGGRPYPLQGGLNVIPLRSGGLGYLSYYTDAYKTAPNIKINIATGKVNGVFDAAVNTNEDWKRLLANATASTIDLRGKYVQLAFSVAAMRQHCPEKGLELINTYDRIIDLEQRLMGLEKYKERPKNHMFGRTVSRGYMFADGIGAGFETSTMAEIGNPDRIPQNAWGIAHEFGHVNQVRPDLLWVSTTEVTNNIYSSWVNYNLNPKDMRLEHERVDGGDGDVAGGRFNAFLNSALVSHEQWLCQRGPDKTENYADGGDHFVKLVPLWQLQLYFGIAGRGNPDFYPDLFHRARLADSSQLANGQLQCQFMRNACDVAKQDLSCFFEAIGMLKPIDKDMDDYSRGQLTITAADCAAVKEYAKRYPQPDSPVIYYISANSIQAYKERLPVVGQKDQGITFRRGRATISHAVWQHVAAFETYQGDKLIKIAMVGTGHPDNSATLVQYPEGATRIEAVAWNGQRTLVCGK
jgi:hypothetical protein